MVRTATTLACLLPPSSHPGSVRVTLSRSVYPGAPEYGTSLGTFVYHPEPVPPLRPAQVQQGPSQPAETHSTVLRATNPRSGPVSGGIEIWLSVEDLPTTFTLYARFGNMVTATVSPTFHLQSQSSDPHVRRFGLRRPCPVYFPLQVTPAL